jgi:DNA-binding response OmpR family regulator
VLFDIPLECKYLFLTAKTRIADKKHGFDCGGDDYLVKPFSSVELLARVQALLAGYLQPTAGNIVINGKKHQAKNKYNPIQLGGCRDTLMNFSAENCSVSALQEF